MKEISQTVDGHMKTTGLTVNCICEAQWHLCQCRCTQGLGMTNDVDFLRKLEQCNDWWCESLFWSDQKKPRMELWATLIWRIVMTFNVDTQRKRQKMTSSRKNNGKWICDGWVFSQIVDESQCWLSWQSHQLKQWKKCLTLHCKQVDKQDDKGFTVIKGQCSLDTKSELEVTNECAMSTKNNKTVGSLKEISWSFRKNETSQTRNFWR